MTKNSIIIKKSIFSKVYLQFINDVYYIIIISIHFKFVNNLKYFGTTLNTYCFKVLHT